jgi:hypothetical protein
MAGQGGEQSRALRNRAAINTAFQRRYHEGVEIDAMGELRVGYRLADEGVLAAILVSAGVSAIFTSTSLTGLSVQACVT